MRVRDHDKEELSFCSKATTDIEFLFPFGWGELWGIADRTDYDLTQHQNVFTVTYRYRIICLGFEVICYTERCSNLILTTISLADISSIVKFTVIFL